jgi:hypothetical protein
MKKRQAETYPPPEPEPEPETFEGALPGVEIIRRPEKRTTGVKHGPAWTSFPPLTKIASGAGHTRAEKEIAAAQARWAKMSPVEREAFRARMVRENPHLSWTGAVPYYEPPLPVRRAPEGSFKKGWRSRPPGR